MLKYVIGLIALIVSIPYCVQKTDQAKNYTKEKVDDAKYYADTKKKKVKEKIGETKVIKDIAKKTFHYRDKEKK